MNLLFSQLKKARSARRAAKDAASGEVRLSVMVASDASPQTARAVREALRPQTANGKLYVAGFGPERGLPPTNTLSDAAVVVSGSSADLAASLYAAHAAAGIACCVVVWQDGGPEGVSRLVDTGVPVEALLPGDAQRVGDFLGSWLVRTLPDLAAVLGAGFVCCRRAQALAVAGEAARNNALVGALPVLDGADMPAMMATEVAMVFKLAETYGLELDKARAAEAACVALSSFGLRGVARAAVRSLPFPAFLVKTAVAAAGTYALGRVLMAYYDYLLQTREPEPRPAHVISVEPVPRDGADSQDTVGARPAV